MNAVIINQHALHFEICLLTILLFFKLYEGILQAITCALVANDFAGQYLPKPTEDKVEVLI
jgi:hypothetical protein